MEGRGSDLAMIKLLCTGAVCALVSAYALRKLLSSWSHLEDGHINQEIRFEYCELEGLDQVGGLKELSGVEFVKRCVLLCEKYTMCLQDFTGESTDPLCLDVGCSVGASTFELSRCFAFVLGIDPSKHRISIAEDLLKNKKLILENHPSLGSSEGLGEVLLDPNLELDGVKFMVADPCALPKTLAPVDCILARNVLSRLHSPKEFLNSLPRLIKSQGTIVLISDHQSNPRSTISDRKIGDYYDKEGKYVKSEEELKALMTQLGFQLVHEEDFPFVKRINCRKFELNISQATVWRKPSQT